MSSHANQSLVTLANELKPDFRWILNSSVKLPTSACLARSRTPTSTAPTPPEVAKFRSGGLPQKPSLSGSSLQLPTSGVSASSCGRSCLTASGPTGPGPTRTWSRPSRKTIDFRRRWTARKRFISWCSTAGRRSALTDRASHLLSRHWTSWSVTCYIFVLTHISL